MQELAQVVFERLIRLGLGNAWVSIAGLILDIVGVWILTWDVLPEFKRWRSERSIDRISRVAETVPKGEVPKVTYRPGGLGVFISEGNLSEQVWSEARGNAVYLGVRDAPEFAHTAGPFDLDAFRRAIGLLRDAAAVRVMRDSRRIRPDLRIGILLVTVGFLLRAWGGFPL